MTKSSIKKFSILGVVLVAASAVTAAIVPSKASDDSSGKLINSTGGLGNQRTCVATVHPAGCNVTAGSSTTAGSGSSAVKNSSAGKHSSQSPS